ncbi:MAG: efflux RND transporter periplasmic adaptor subunit [Alphaproteobacteria bacterium]|nr:efflux RND transporter periplasmic adaptor subunit [Alphaproteobacteria bacterium]
MSKKENLLSQLRIDRDEKQPDSQRPTIIILLSLAVGIALGWGLFFLTSVAGKADISRPEQGSLAINSTNTPAPDSGTKATAKAVAQLPVDNIALDASGYIIARRLATVSAKITDRITNVFVEEGMSVKKGQILATLDDTIARVNLKLAIAQTKVAKARVDSARASLAEAKRVLARISELKSRNFSSEAKLTLSTLNVETTRAGLARAIADAGVARLKVVLQQKRLENYTIRAPFSGIVTIKNAQPGEIVSPISAGGGFTRTGICTIVDMSSLEIEADVNEAFIGRIYRGQRVKANLDAYPDWDIKARVIAIIPTANRNKATVRVRIRLLQTDPRILPEMGVKIVFFNRKRTTQG